MSGNKGGKVAKGQQKPASKKPVRVAQVSRIEPAPQEHEFGDSPFANAITMHTGIRVFTATIIYTLAAHNDNPMMAAVSEQVQSTEHTIQIAIAGPKLDEVPISPVYPTIDDYRSRFAEQAVGSRAQATRIVDNEATYYGTLAAERLIRETDSQATILAVDVEEHHIPNIFLSAVEG